MKEGNSFDKKELEDTLAKVGLNRGDLSEIYEKMGVQAAPSVDLD